MIPKKIHYCWFGGNPIPEKDRACIESWRKFCPDFEIIRWDETNYDVNKIPYISEAYRAGKWGFVSDYARLDIVYNEGGIYLDTDVEIIKDISPLLEQEAYMGFESEHSVASGLGFGAEKGNPVIRAIMESYSDRRFILPDGSADLTPCPASNTQVLRDLGLKCDNSFQTLQGMSIYPRDYFCPMDYVTGKTLITPNTYSIHRFHESWKNKNAVRVISICRRCIDAFGMEKGRKIGRILAFPFSVAAKFQELGFKNALNYAKSRIGRG